MDITRISASTNNSNSVIKTGTEVNSISPIEGKLNELVNRNNKLSKQEVKVLVDNANDVFSKANTHLKFKVHEKTHDVIVNIINDETGEVIKEIPSEKLVDMIAKMCENLGIFLDAKK